MARRAPLRASPRTQFGLTLVELMVSLVLGLVLALVITYAQRTFSTGNARMSSVSQRDGEARAAMDILARDAGSAGFLFGGSNIPCDTVLTYNSAFGLYGRLPIEARAAASGMSLPFGAATINYPPSGTPSDVLAITGSTSIATLNDVTSPLVKVTPNAGYDPVNIAQLPVANNISFVPGHVAFVQVPDLERRACIRVPVSALGASSGSLNFSSVSGPLMPSAGYSGFSPLMAANGFSGPLSNAQLFQSRVYDAGAVANPSQTTTLFYVDGPSANAPWPTLMRAEYSLLDDQLISRQPIAAGVVSLQILFGVDPGETGAVTAYETGTVMRASNHQWSVRSIRIALITRALHPDPDYTNPTTSVTVPGGFTSVPIEAAFVNHRFTVNQTEVSARNCLWLKC